MLECEREYQEHLLLSVMPAYIAAEVVFRLMKKDFKETKKKFYSNNLKYKFPTACLTITVYLFWQN